MDAKSKRAARVRRHGRVRKKVSGDATRPRLAVFRSNRHIYVQLIDDRIAKDPKVEAIAQSPAAGDRCVDVPTSRASVQRIGRTEKAISKLSSGIAIAWKRIRPMIPSSWYVPE